MQKGKEKLTNVYVLMKKKKTKSDQNMRIKNGSDREIEFCLLSCEVLSK